MPNFSEVPDRSPPKLPRTHLDDNRLEGVLDGHDEDLVPHGIQVPVNGARLVEEAAADLELDIRITQSCGRDERQKKFLAAVAVHCDQCLIKHKEVGRIMVMVWVW